MRYCGIERTAISPKILQIFIVEMSLKFTNLRLQSNPPGANELNLPHSSPDEQWSNQNVDELRRIQRDHSSGNTPLLHWVLHLYPSHTPEVHASRVDSLLPNSWHNSENQTQVGCHFYRQYVLERYRTLPSWVPPDPRPSLSRRSQWYQYELHGQICQLYAGFLGQHQSWICRYLGLVILQDCRWRCHCCQYQNHELAPGEKSIRNMKTKNIGIRKFSSIFNNENIYRYI